MGKIGQNRKNWTFSKHSHMGTHLKGNLMRIPKMYSVFMPSWYYPRYGTFLVFQKFTFLILCSVASFSVRNFENDLKVYFSELRAQGKAVPITQLFNVRGPKFKANWIVMLVALSAIVQSNKQTNKQILSTDQMLLSKLKGDCQIAFIKAKSCYAIDRIASPLCLLFARSRIYTFSVI